jgi:ankyrin repeat protein
MHLAVELNDLALTQLLVEYGADAALTNSDGLSPIDIAISSRN